MSIFMNMVDKTAVNYENTFVYSYKVGLGEISQEIKNAKIITIIPSNIEFYVPTPEDSSVIVTEIPLQDATRVIFDFGEVGYKGYMIDVEVRCKFRYPGIEGDTYINSAELIINNDEENAYVDNADEVTLQVVPQFTVFKQLVTPVGGPSAGGFCICKIILSNSGDKGAGITNFTLTDVIPANFTLNPLWEIYGNDTSAGDFKDNNPEYVNRKAKSIAEDLKSFTFDLPGTYTGTEYTIEVICNVDENAKAGQYGGNVTWSYLDAQSSINEYSISVSLPQTSLSLLNAPPQFVKRGNLFYSQLSILNTGNTVLNGITLTIDVPPEITPIRFHTGTLGIPEINWLYDYDYVMTINLRNDKGETTQVIVPDLNTNTDTVINTADLKIPDGYYATNVVADLNGIVPGLQTIANPETLGVVNNVGENVNGIQSSAYITWDNGEQRVTANSGTNINENVGLVLIVDEISDDLLDETVSSKDTVRYSSLILCPMSYVYMPILVEVLPPELEFAGNVVYEYYDYLTKTTYRSDDPDVIFPLKQPVPEETVVDGINVVRFKFTGEYEDELKQNDTLTISFDTKIKNGIYAVKTIKNFMYLGNYGASGIIGEGMINFADTDADWDGDGFVVDTLAQSNTVSVDVEYCPFLLMNTSIRYNENVYDHEDMPVKIRKGSVVDYICRIDNMGTKDVYNLEIVDILPYVDDLSIINVEVSRGSQLEVGYDASYINVYGAKRKLDIIDGFSDSNDPIRFNRFDETIGTGEWTRVSDENTRSVKITLNENEVLQPAEAVELLIEVSIPDDITEDVIACNSFAARASYLKTVDETEALTPLPPVEPYKQCGITAIGKEISGTVFIDTDKTGIYNPKYKGLNGVLVSLYNSNAEKMQEVLTKNIDDVDGSYRFENLEVGEYSIIFTPDDRKYKFTKQVLDNPLGSKPDSKGLTPPIKVTDLIFNVDAYAGLLDVAIENIIEVNTQAQKTVRGTMYSNIALGMKMGDTFEMLGYDR